jgi:hypothetical protein
MDEMMSNHKMTNEQIVERARILRHQAGYGLGANLGLPPFSHFIIEAARENWTPPQICPTCAANKERP